MLQVSHAWQDGHQRKVQMLRAFLCLDALLAQTAVAAVLLAAFLFPLGTGISVWVHWFPWWGPSMLPLALLALVLLLVALSRMGAMNKCSGSRIRRVSDRVLFVNNGVLFGR